MIKVQDNVPSVYYNNSRDFQLLGRTLEVILNYIKMNVDIMEGNYRISNLNQVLTPYLLKTLGFESERVYTNIDLLLLARAFKHIMYKKGTKQALVDIVNLVLRSLHIEEDYEVIVPTIDTNNIRPQMDDNMLSELYTIVIMLPSSLQDTKLIEDLLDYILPTGFVYKFITLQDRQKYKTKLTSTIKTPIRYDYVSGDGAINKIYKSNASGDISSGVTNNSTVFNSKNYDTQHTT